jgi:hypothetical protein
MWELLLSPEVLMVIGPCSGILILSIFNTWMNNKSQTQIYGQLIDEMRDDRTSLITEMKADREQSREELRTFKTAVDKIDTRLNYIERLIERK